MHEQSLVRSLLSQVRNSITPHAGCCVDEIHVEIGPLAGVEPLLVESAFEQLVETSAVCGARLVIEEVPLTAVCAACEKTFVIERYHFVCRDCGSRQVRVTKGDEFRLVSVTIQDPARTSEGAP